jgi:hypothetical protein
MSDSINKDQNYFIKAFTGSSPEKFRGYNIDPISPVPNQNQGEYDRYDAFLFLKIQKSLEKIEDHEKKIEEITKEADIFKEKLKGAEIKSQETQVKIIECLGIFIALFTFISVEFQILQNISNFFELLSLSLILFSALSFFVVLMDVVISIWKNEKTTSGEIPGTHKVLLIIAALIFIIGLSCGTFGSSEKANSLNYENSSKTKIELEPALLAPSHLEIITTY